MNLLGKILFEEHKDDSGVGGGAGNDPEAFYAAPGATPPVDDKKPDPAVSGGYDANAPDPATPPAEEKKPDPATPPDPSATGYGEQPPVVPPVEEKKEGEQKPDDKTPPAEELKLNVDGLDPKQAEKMLNFAKSHKLSKEAAQALVDDRKAEMTAQKVADANYDKAVQAKIAETKQAWHKELKTHASFGGENFQKNLHNVDKVLNQFFTETKSVLTKNKNMLPPYVMRDLAKVANHLYGSDSLVQGEAPRVESNDDQNDPLSFYTTTNKQGA